MLAGWGDCCRSPDDNGDIAAYAPQEISNSRSLATPGLHGEQRRETGRSRLTVIRMMALVHVVFHRDSALLHESRHRTRQPGWMDV